MVYGLNLSAQIEIPKLCCQRTDALPGLGVVLLRLWRLSAKVQGIDRLSRKAHVIGLGNQQLLSVCDRQVVVYPLTLAD